MRFIVPAGILLLILLGTLSRRGEETHEGTDGEEVAYLTAEELGALLREGRPALIEFGGRGCAPCREMQPVLTEFRSAHGALVEVANIDLNEYPDLADRYDIMVIPTQIVFSREGKELGRHLGVWPRGEIEAEFRRLGIIP